MVLQCWVDVANQPKPAQESMALEVICPFCKLISKNLFSLKVHIENIHINPVTCSDKLNEESIPVQGYETYTKCPHCVFVGPKNEIETHISKKHGYIFICGECGNSFPDTKTCEVHI